MVEIDSLTPDDIVRHIKHGIGVIVSHSQRPSVKAKFPDGKTRMFANANKCELNKIGRIGANNVI